MSVQQVRISQRSVFIGDNGSIKNRLTTYSCRPQPSLPSVFATQSRHRRTAGLAQPLVADGRLEPPAAIGPILVALTTNTLTKMIFAVSAGGRTFALYVIPGLILMVIAAWAGILFVPKN